MQYPHQRVPTAVRIESPTASRLRMRMTFRVQSKIFASAVLQLSRNRSVGARGNALLRLGMRSATESKTINQQDERPVKLSEGTSCSSAFPYLLASPFRADCKVGVGFFQTRMVGFLI